MVKLWFEKDKFAKKLIMLLLFRISALLEGLSYILLLFIAVPIKYFLDNPLFVKWLGMPHGLLFLTYILMAIWLKPSFNWSIITFFKVLIASIIPFGTFYVDKHYIKKYE